MLIGLPANIAAKAALTIAPQAARP